MPLAIVQKGMSNQEFGDRIWLAAKLKNRFLLTIHNARPKKCRTLAPPNVTIAKRNE